MNLIKIFSQLYKEYGPQYWWPVKDRKHDPSFEICTGAILTQNTAWTNVESALECLVEANLMSPRAVLNCSLSKLQKCLRPSGYYKQKAKKLKLFSQWIITKYQGHWQSFFHQPLKKSREELLSLWGIGPETADSILLYAGQKPIFVIDAYTKRLCEKYGVRFKTYDEYQRFFERGLSKGLKDWSKIRIYNEFHALIVKWGKSNKK